MSAVAAFRNDREIIQTEKPLTEANRDSVAAVAGIISNGLRIKLHEMKTSHGPKVHNE